jgi:hypothetical protein
MAIILKANKVNLFVSSVLFVFWDHSPSFLDTPRILLNVTRGEYNMPIRNQRVVLSECQTRFHYDRALEYIATAKNRVTSNSGLSIIGTSGNEM